MKISDLSITRPVFASVISLLLIAFGLVSFDRLPLRQYPDIDPPVVSVDTRYTGAAAAIVESRITQVIEDQVAGISGIDYMSSSSRDGRSRVTISFKTGVNIDEAASDIRDRIAGIADNLPDGADPPEIEKSNSDDDVILWLSLTSPEMSALQLTDYAARALQDRFSAVEGVARVRIGGGLNYAMRVWLDPMRLAARNLTPEDVESALRAENIELPAGDIESKRLQFTAKMERGFRSAQDFRNLVISAQTGTLVRLGDVARIALTAEEERIIYRGNSIPRVGLGVIKQSQANILDVTEGVKALAKRLNTTLPQGMRIEESYDRSVFVSKAIEEVYKTLGISIALVVLMIFLFLGNARAMLVPAVTVPVSVIAAFIVLFALGYSINLLTLLALVLGIGLIVDDAIVVLENIYRRIQLGETPLVAAFLGTRQVAFAVVATTAVLIAVFIPISFAEGDLGRLFTEFAITMSASVAFSSLIALTLSPMLASQLLKRKEAPSRLSLAVDRFVGVLQSLYAQALNRCLKARFLILIVFFGLAGASAFLYPLIPQEFAPKEDRGAFFIIIKGPEGASFDYMEPYIDEIEQRLLSYVDTGEVKQLIMRAPRSFGVPTSFNSGIAIIVLSDWSRRRSTDTIMAEIRRQLSDLPGVRAFPIMRRGLGGGTSKPVQFVLGGGSYAELADWRDHILDQVRENNPGLQGLDSDYDETRPSLRISIDQDRAGDLGVSVSAIGRTLETMMGSRRVTTFLDRGEEYDVILEAEKAAQQDPVSLENLYVRSSHSGALIPLANLVTIEVTAEAERLNRYNRLRAITLEANLDPNLTLGEALTFLEQLVRSELPDTAVIDYKGESLKYKTSGDSMIFVFILGIAVVFLVLAAQFESFIHPFIVMLTVPLAIVGALIGLLLMGQSLNIYTQIGLIMLVGLATKNGILIVEFVNQKRDDGLAFDEALRAASLTRFRPILMTSLTTIAGAIPLVLAFGAGAETRIAIGIVIMFGVSVATVLTLFIIPVAYSLLARKTGAAGDVKRRLEAEWDQTEDFRSS